MKKKESFKWIEIAKNTKLRFILAKKITFISDRENDIYEYFDRIPDERTHILVRSSSNRKLVNKEKLFEKLDALEPEFCYKLDLLPITGRRVRRTANLEVSYTAVELERPRSVNDKNAKKHIRLNAILIKEVNSGIPDKDKVMWRLLTTHEINNVEDALRIINWYVKRWIIEQLFRTLKKQGLDIENSRLSHGDSLKKLAIASLITAVKTMQLVQARDGNNDRTLYDVFENDDVPLLEKLNKHLEGNTEKQKNPYKPKSLAWTSWVIGRLGGWKGYKSEKPPGPITMGDGIKEFNSIKIGYFLE